MAQQSQSVLQRESMELHLGPTGTPWSIMTPRLLFALTILSSSTAFHLDVLSTDGKAMFVLA